MKSKIVLWCALAGALGAVLGSLDVMATGSAPARPGHSKKGKSLHELFVPESWAGQWEFEIEYRHPETGALLATEEVAAPLCSGDRLGLSSLLPVPRHPRGSAHVAHRRRSRTTEADCRGKLIDHGLALGCDVRLETPLCALDFRVDVDLPRIGGGDVLAGAAEWRMVSSAGDCDSLLEGAIPGESVLLSGTRVSRDPEGCTAPPESLIEKLTSQPDLMRALPVAIDDLSARVTGRAVHLRWSAMPGAVAYDLYRAPAEGAYQWVRVLKEAPRPAHVVDPLPRFGSTFRYVVSWRDTEGRKSPVSNEIRVTARTGSANEGAP